MLKIAVFAPMPSASVSTATAVKPGFFSNCRKANLKSFITQSLHGMNFRGAAGRQPGSKQRDNQKHCRDTDECEWVGRFDFVEQLRQQVCQAEGGGHAENKTERNEFHAVAEHELEHITATSAQGE